MTAVAAFHNPEIWEQLPNAKLTGSARDVLDILTARQEPGGLVRIQQKELAHRLGMSQAAISRAMGQLKDLGIIHPRTKQGQVLIHPLLAGYESLHHMVNHIEDPGTHLWPLNFPTGDIRPPRRSDARTGTDFDPDPDGGEDAPLPRARPTFRLAG
ncbi:winged helix-turn-helix domain-containing protein [Streptomyces sp. NPDC089799]|uniref:winged helix-turn-helix domain-containing protein n=1 Tax=Streptomyces sp. NPDC089799 TaxID=3155066 RepID=UPI003433F80A